MKSQTSLAARNCRLQEWSKMVHSCNNRPIGMSVDEWCRENSITTANYYYRMTQVRKACLDSLSDEAVNQEVVPDITCQTPAKKLTGIQPVGERFGRVTSITVFAMVSSGYDLLELEFTFPTDQSASCYCSAQLIKRVKK